MSTMFLSNKVNLKLVISTLIVLLVIVNENSAMNCVNNELPTAYLDIAMDMLKKAKDHYPTVLSASDRIFQPQDCDDIVNYGNTTSGIYKVWPRNRVMNGKSIDVYCDMETDGGGWTVIQRRGDFKRSFDYFYQDWESYKKGFGDLDKDFWLGNDNIFAISNQKEYAVRFDLRDVNRTTRYAMYDYFWIDDEYHKYMLHIKNYRGDAGDSMYPKHDGQKFSTKDQKNDNRDKAEGCAVTYRGAWWYNACHDSNLNGLYLKGNHESHANGVNWKSWKGHKESLLETEIKLRPRYSKRSSATIPASEQYKPTPTQGQTDEEDLRPLKWDF